MAKVLESFNFTRKSGGPRKWNWDEFLDGQIRQVDKADLGDTTKPATFAMQLRKQAKVRNKSVRMQMTEDGVVWQAIPRPEKVAASNGQAAAEANGDQAPEGAETTTEAATAAPVAAPAPTPPKAPTAPQKPSAPKPSPKPQGQKK